MLWMIACDVVVDNGVMYDDMGCYNKVKCMYNKDVANMIDKRCANNWQVSLALKGHIDK